MDFNGHYCGIFIFCLMLSGYADNQIFREIAPMNSRKIYIPGHRGLIGSALVRNLKSRGYSDILGKSRQELDLLNPGKTKEFLAAEKPDSIIVAAALVGGIHANNTYRSEFIYQNLQIQNNIIWSAHELGINNLIFLGSSCIYPRQAPQPMPEGCLLTGPLEYTNRPYAIAKIAGMELVNCIRQQYGRNYFSVMPTNLYGPGDNFHPENSHVMPALIRRFVEAKAQNAAEVVIWGSGTPLREFLHVDDCADAIVHLMETVKNGSLETLPPARDGWYHVNVGSGSEVSIADLAQTVSDAVGFKGKLVFDRSKPDGTPRKLMDNSLLRGLGWTPKISLKEGVQSTVKWYLESPEARR
jgi:GDP-L-fucose synthase